MWQTLTFFISLISGSMLLLITATGLTTETTCSNCTTKVETETYDDGSTYTYHNYRRGKRVCTDESEERFKYDSEDLDNRYFYASCLVIKGEDSKGLPMLYILADQHSHVLASDFLANYLRTDGRFELPLTHVAVDESIKYYMRSQVLIKLMPHYPEPYEFIERNSQIELNSIYYVPHLYLLKYNIDSVGDLQAHLLQSPSYEGDRNIDTYPKYNTYMRDSLNNVIRYAGECANLPQKEHFNVRRYQATTESCRLMRDLAVTLLPLEEKRQEILRQPHCEDLKLPDSENACETGEYHPNTNCLEYSETHCQINELMTDYIESYVRLFTDL